MLAYLEREREDGLLVGVNTFDCALFDGPAASGLHTGESITCTESLSNISITSVSYPLISSVKKSVTQYWKRYVGIVGETTERAPQHGQEYTYTC